MRGLEIARGELATKISWIGSSSAISSGMWRTAPSSINAVFKAVKGLILKSAC